MPGAEELFQYRWQAADGSWSAWQPVPENGQLTYPDNALQVQRNATRKEFATLDEAIEATVRDLVEMASAPDRGFKERIVQQGVAAFKELIDRLRKSDQSTGAL
jgi:hypothetical protein